MEEWIDIVVKVNSKDSEAASAVCLMASKGGIYVDDFEGFIENVTALGVDSVVDEELMNTVRNSQESKIHVYIGTDEQPNEIISFIRDRLESSQISYELDTSNIKEEDWANNWKKFFKPLPVGKDLIIVPTWDENIKPEDQNRVQLKIDPGMAFGSGRHETTKLCLESLEETVTEFIKTRGEAPNILDVGTGSGILAIGALLLGAKSATGVDIDALSVRVSQENAKLNNVDDKYTAIQGDLAKDVHEKFDIICANIVADIILRLLPDCGALLNEGGCLILSGIIEERLPDVLSRLHTLLYNEDDIKKERGWCTVRARKIKFRRPCPFFTFSNGK